MFLLDISSNTALNPAEHIDALLGRVLRSPTTVGNIALPPIGRLSDRLTLNGADDPGRPGGSVPHTLLSKTGSWSLK